MKFALGFAVFVVLARFPNLADAQNDDTRKPGASGEAVVRSTVNLIRGASSLQFPDDKELLRRIALVETKYGTDNDTYRENYHGGIWQLDEDMFIQTQTIVMPNTRLATNIMKEFQIDWHAITWEDLRKPLYSGLAARLFLFNITEEIPLASDIEGQAKYWKTYYDVPSGNGTEEEFVAAVLALPEFCHVRGIDLVLLLDSSGSIGYFGFNLIKSFVTDLVNGLDIGPNASLVGVIKYSYVAHTEFHLNQYDDKSAVLQAISAINYIAGSTATHLGLQAVLSEFNNYSRPLIEGVPRVAFVLTDGESDIFEATINASKELHAANIVVYAVAIGSNANEKELNAIATKPENVLNTNFNVAQLKELQEFLEREACKAVVIAPVGQPFDGMLDDGEIAYFEYDMPKEGLTVKVTVKEGYVVIYLSTIVSNPNEALHEIKLVTDTTASVFIPSETLANEQEQEQDTANDTVKVYISIEGRSSLNHYILDTTRDDTTPPELPLKIKFERDSPLVSGNNITAFIHTSKPVTDMKCRMSGTKEVKDCTSGYVEFNDLPDRKKYTLKVVAETEERETAIIRREFSIEQPGYCTAHLINEGVSIQGSRVTVEFTPTGDTQDTACILDPPKAPDHPFFPCSNPVLMFLSPGHYKFKITPKGCGPKRKPAIVTFEV